MVNGSPSISISRRIVLSSFVAMGFSVLVPVRSRIGPVGGVLRLFTPQQVVYEPCSLLLTNDRLSNHSGRPEHVVGGLQHPLEMRRISLHERQLLAQAVHRDAPRERAACSRDFEEPVQTPRYRGGKGEVPRDAEGHGVTGRHVLSEHR